MKYSKGNHTHTNTDIHTHTYSHTNTHTHTQENIHTDTHVFCHFYENVNRSLQYTHNNTHTYTLPNMCKPKNIKEWFVIVQLYKIWLQKSVVGDLYMKKKIGKGGRCSTGSLHESSNFPF